MDVTSSSPGSPLLALAAAEQARARAARLARDAARLEAALRAVERRAVDAGWSGPVREAFGEALRLRRATLTDAAGDLRSEAERLGREAVGLEQGAAGLQGAGLSLAPRW